MADLPPNPAPGVLRFWPMVYDITQGAYFHAVTKVRAEVLDIETDQRPLPRAEE